MESPTPPPPSATLAAGADPARALARLDQYLAAGAASAKNQPQFASAVLHLQWLLPPASTSPDPAIVASCFDRLGMLFQNGNNFARGCVLRVLQGTRAPHAATAGPAGGGHRSALDHLQSNLEVRCPYRPPHHPHALLC